MRVRLTVLGLAAASMASAGVGVVPNANAGTEGDSAFFLTDPGGPRTYQFVIDSGQLGAFSGMFLDGLAFRLNGGATAWPGVAASFADFDILIGAGVDPSAISNTFASNFTGGVTTVRTGALAIGAGAFTSSGSPNAFGPTIAFSNYLYSGGDLAIEMRFSAPTGPTDQSPFDANSLTAAGYGTAYAAKWAGGFGATTGNSGNFLITQISASPVPEPATMAVLGLGAAALLRRRKK